MGMSQQNSKIATYYFLPTNFLQDKKTIRLL